MAQKTYTLREYAKATGQHLAAVRQQAHRGTLPTQLVESPVGSYRIVTQAQVDAYQAQQVEAAINAHYTHPDHDEENFRGCTHPDCLAAQKTDREISREKARRQAHQDEATEAQAQ